MIVFAQVQFSNFFQIFQHFLLSAFPPMEDMLTDFVRYPENMAFSLSIAYWVTFTPFLL